MEATPTAAEEADTEAFDPLPEYFHAGGEPVIHHPALCLLDIRYIRIDVFFNFFNEPVAGFSCLPGVRYKKCQWEQSLSLLTGKRSVSLQGERIIRG